MAAFWERLAEPLPDPSIKGRNASAIFGAGPSFGLTPAEVNIRPQFRPAPPKKASVPRKIKRSHSDVGIRKKPNLRRKSGDFSQLRKHSESESESILNGAVCNGEENSPCPLSPKSEDTEPTADSITSLPEQSRDSSDFAGRYPLFIQVNDNAQAQNKARVVKPVNRPGAQVNSKQETVQNKRSIPRNRSASVNSVKKVSDSRPPIGAGPRSSPSSHPIQETVRNGHIRREKSDVVKSRRAQPSPPATTAIPRPTRSHSSSSLKQEKGGVLSPRSQSPSDVTKQRGAQGLRREKSDVNTVRSRGPSRTNSPTPSNEDLDSGISRSSSNRSLTSSPLNKCPSKSSIQESRSQSNSNSDMSKIPSLARSPASSESHVSRIPSLAKQNGGEERTPPRSKIPSVSKGDAVKKSQIPTGPRKDSASHKEKPASKIQAPSAGLSQSRPDSAKENKDPTRSEADGSHHNGHETVKPISKIPSFGKSGIPKSRIPSVTRKESQTEEPPALNGSSGVQSPVSHSEAAKSRIPSSSPASSGTGIPVGVSRIPGSTRSPQPKQDTKQESPVGSLSRIPTTPSAPANRTPETKLPTMGGSKLPEPKIKSPPSSLPVSKTTGIPKPPAAESTPSEQTAKGSRIPGYSGERATRKISSTEREALQSNIPAVSSPTDTRSRIPSFSKMATPKTYSTASSAGEQATPKPKYGIPTLGGKQLSFEKEAEGAGSNSPATPPSTPTLETAPKESPLHTDIFSEAKRMEKLFREVPMELEVFEKENEEDDEFLRQEREMGLEEDEMEQENDQGLGFVDSLDSKEAEDLISEVLKSYAPDINKENKPELQNIMNDTDKDDNRNLKEKVNLDDIVFQTARSETKVIETKEKSQAKEEKIQLSLPVNEVRSSEEKVEQIPKVLEKVPDLKVSSSVENEVTDVEESKNEGEENEGAKSEGPPIDTLGEYAQHARRSRSRQRKVVSPDSEEPEKEFIKAPEKDVEKGPEKEPANESEESSPKEQPKKDIKKDKFGTAPFEGEKKGKESSKSKKPKFVIESSLGKDFYAASRKSDEIAESKESIPGDKSPYSSKRELPSLVFENKVVKQPIALKTEAAPSVEQAVAVEDAKFEDIDLNPEPENKKQRQEIYRSVEDLDEKTVKCMCGRGGKCSIM